MEKDLKKMTAQDGNSVECKKCHKQVAPENAQQTDKGIVCNDCVAKAKRNRIIVLFTVLGCLILGALIWFFVANNDKKSATATGFDGVTEINDSLNVVVDSVDVEFNIATATLSSAPVSTQAPVSNIEEFKRVLAQNVKAAKSGKENTLNVPVSAIMFSFKSAELTPEALNLIKEVTNLYGQTDKSGIINVDGYACNIGEDAPNDYISQQRVEAVKSALVALGVNPSKIELHWYGKSKNAEFNLPKNEDNRRVLISVK
ncbi:MAG: OmpA family protein [Muribaculum sp.]|nr:OmpA family protein [Muribaculum sp.]